MTNTDRIARAIEEAGYTKVTDLKKDDNGVWRGKASKGGSATAVSVDFQGNVNKFIGDGILAYFGWPGSLDNHAASAVSCALDKEE